MWNYGGIVMSRGKTNGFERVFVSFFSFVVSLFCAVFPSSISAELRYQVIDLGTLGGNMSSAMAINDNGQIVGVSVDMTGAQRGFLWQAGVMTSLPVVGDGDVIAEDINNSGVITGTRLEPSGWSYGFVYDGTVVEELGQGTTGAGINNFGHIVGGLHQDITVSHAYIWQNGSITDLGAPDGLESYAHDVNGKGQVVGYLRTESSEYITHPTMWDNGAIIDLGTLGGSLGEAYAINEIGDVVGSARTAAGQTHAFLWHGGVITDIGAFESNDTSANDINDKGQIVGIGMIDSSEVAILWEHGIIVNLNDFIPSQLGWNLLEANSINNSGWIVGAGTIAGETHGFLLVPVPEPGMIMLISAGLLMFRMRKRNFGK